MVKKKKRDLEVKKPFKLGALSLISMVFFIFLSMVSESFGLVILASFFSLLFFIAAILAFVSVYYLGKKYKSNFLMKTVIIGFILYFVIFLFGSYFSGNYYEGYKDFSDTILERESNLQEMIEQNMSQEVISSYERETFNYFVETGLPLLVPFIIIYLIFAIYSTFLGIAFIKLEKVKYSKAIGVITIVSVWLVPTIIGIFLAIPLMFANYVLMVLIFLEESKKAKE